MSKESEPDLFTGDHQRIVRSVSTPGEAEPFIQARLKELGMTYQEYIASLVAYDCWAQKPHALTGPESKGHRSAKEARAAEKRLWAEIAADWNKVEKTGSLFAHRVAEFVRKKFDGL